MATFQAVPFPELETLDIRELESCETWRLTSILKKLGWSIPLPNLAGVMIAEASGDIIGFGVLQLMPHAEPLWVDEKYRGTKISKMILQKIKDKLGDVPCMCVTNNEFAEKLARDMGMVEVPGKLFVKK